MANATNHTNHTMMNGSMHAHAAMNMTEQMGKLIQERLMATNTNIDAFFVVTVGMIIFFMQCGFAFLEAGTVRTKNVTNILMKNIMDAFIGGLFYWAIGYALAFGNGNIFIGYDYFFCAIPHTLPTNQIHLWFFQFVFASTSSTIISGAVAERCNTTAYFVYSALVIGVIYPIAAHWAWSTSGWLNIGNGEGIGYQDFAGSGVVHLLGGTAAFVGALFLGPRIGRFDEYSNPIDIPGHSVPLVSLGFFILMFGFFAFNGGSQASISKPGDGEAIARSVQNTVLAASSGGLFGLLFKRLFSCCGRMRNKMKGKDHWSLLTTINCSLTGMVAICAGSDVFYPWAAALTGMIASLSYLLFSFTIVSMGVDDPLDAVAVHFGGGVIGVVLAPIFNMKTGLLYKPGVDSAMALAWNVGGGAAIMGWTALTSVAIFTALRAAKRLRVSFEIELEGLDVMKHNEQAYPEWMRVINDKKPKELEAAENILKKNGSLQKFDNEGFEAEVEEEDNKV